MEKGVIETNQKLKVSHDQEINNLRKQHDLEKAKLRERYEQKLGEVDRIVNQAVSEETKRIKSSWTWRIGSIVVAPAILAQHLFMNRFKPRLPQNDLAPSVPDAQPENFEKVTMGCIFDTFTYNCYKYEFNIISPTPENWNAMLAGSKVKGLFVESAWFGNQNAWKNQIGKFSKTSEVNLNALLQWCKSNGIPTIFWNKEDPVHFDYFLNDAKKFDFIFTTDEGVVPRYREAVLHEHVYALPFAAQPMIHNPARDNTRDGSVCFAGTYYNQRYIERKGDMDILLRPSLDFGLDIYDRNLGLEGMEAEKYRFPDIYQPAIRGRLDYPDMVKAYKRYKVFLNVNSVRNSSTMFARRVFELLACGTPVISTYSKGIVEILGEGTVLITESEEETRSHLQNLLHDDQYWWKQSLNGMRTVMESHTYANRTGEVFSRVGLDTGKAKPVDFTVVAEIGSFSDAEYVAGILRRQHYRHFDVHLIPAAGFPVNGAAAEKLKSIYSFTGMVILKADLSRAFRELAGSSQAQYIAFLSPKHYYGKNYLRDYALASAYADRDILAKCSYFASDEAGGFILANKGAEFQCTRHFHPATAVVNRKILTEIMFQHALSAKGIQSGDLEAMSLDPYNFLDEGRSVYLQHRLRIEEKVDL